MVFLEALNLYTNLFKSLLLVEDSGIWIYSFISHIWVLSCISFVLDFAHIFGLGTGESEHSNKSPPVFWWQNPIMKKSHK